MNDQMSGGDDEVERANAQRISALGDSLQEHGNDEAMLANIHTAIQALLAESADSEAGIRAELQKRFEAGQIRPESYELVRKMLDRIAHGNTTKLKEPAEHIQTAKIDPAPLQQTQRIEPTMISSGPSSDVIEDEADFINTAVIADQPTQKTAVDDQLQVGSVLRDRFLLQEKMPGGSMGVVFKALDRRMAEAGEGNPYVAIKVLSAKLSRNGNALRALQQEASKGRFLAHPNIVRFIDLDRDDALHFIVMEWLEGKTLAEVLDESPTQKVDLPMALNIVSQVGRALDYAHLRGVVHADVKPANIIITPDGHAKLFDFGVARIRQKQTEGQSRFDPGVLGAASPAYSSMQVLTGEDPAPADDVFSLGCLFYRLIAGIRVFGPRNAADAAVEGMEPQRPPGIHDDQWRALKKALSYSRVTRFSSPKAFTDALKAGANAPRESALPEATAPTRAPSPAPAPAPSAVNAPIAKPTPPVRAVAPTPVMTAMRDPDETSVLDEDDTRRSPLRLAIMGLLLVATVGIVTQTDVAGYIDEYIDSAWFRSLTGEGSQDQNPAVLTTRSAPAEQEIIDAPPSDVALQPDIVGTSEGMTEEIQIGGEPTIDTGVPPVEIDVEAVEPVVEAAPLPEPVIPEFDYTGWPEPTTTLALPANGESAIEKSVSIREDAGDAIVELTRFGNAPEALALVVNEAGFSGGTSPQSAGQYAIGNGGKIDFDPGQERAQIVINMPSDLAREADSNVTLQIQDANNPGVSLGTINLTLEDDDQRAFESALLPNTVSFRVSEIIVNEADPAVQVDVIRYRPGNASLDVEYLLRDVTASEGQDYFAPGFNFISFGPGQRTARLLIPLGQDALTEPNEAFVIELLTLDAPVADITTRVAVMIRDDD